MASMCAAGHAIAGRKMFYRPIKSAILITIYFVLSAVTLFVLSFRGWGDAVAWLIATQFAGYAALYLIISLRLGGALKLFQWVPFGSTAILTAVRAVAAP
jgi:hypothetical protein